MNERQISKMRDFSEKVSTDKKLLFFSIGVFLFAFTCFFLLKNIIFSFITYNGKGTFVVTMNEQDMKTLTSSNYFRDQCNFKNIIECKTIDEIHATEPGANYVIILFNEKEINSIPSFLIQKSVIVYADTNKKIIDQEFVYDGLFRKIYNDPYGNIYSNFYKDKHFTKKFLMNSDENAYSRVVYFTPKL